MKNRYSILCLSVLLLFSIPSAVMAETVGESSQVTQDEYTLSEVCTEQVYNDDQFTLFIDRETATFSMLDKEHGHVYDSCPPDWQNDSIVAVGSEEESMLNNILTISYYDTKKQRNGTATGTVDSLDKGGLSVRLMKRGVEFDFNFSDLDILIPLQVQIVDGHLSVKVQASKITESEIYKLLTLTITPLFGAAGGADKGYLLVPDGCGGIIRFNNGKTDTSPYSEYVYGQDASDGVEQSSAVKEIVRMPVFGMVKNGSGFLAVVSQGSAQSKITACSGGQRTSYNNAYAQFEYRKSGTYTIDTFSTNKFMVVQNSAPSMESMEVCYNFLSNKASLTEMATSYKTKWLALAEKTQDTQSAPTVLTVLGAVQREGNLFGIPYNYHDPISSFQQVTDAVTSLTEAGATNLVLRYDNWNTQQISGTAVDKAAWDSSLGSNSSRKKLLALLKEKKIPLYLDVQPVVYNNETYMFEQYFDAVKGISGSVSTLPTYYLSTYLADNSRAVGRLLRPSILVKKFGSFIKSVTKQNISGVSVSGLGDYNYSDFSNNAFDREKTRQTMLAAFEQLKGKSGVMLNQANDYAWPYADWLLNVPVSTDRMNAIDEDVPFYQLCVSGCIRYTTPAINMYATYETMVRDALKTGSSMHYVLGMDVSKEKLKGSVYESYIGSKFSLWQADILKQYTSFQEAALFLGNYVIRDYLLLQEGVTQTVYDNGYSVLVNETAVPVTVKEHIIDAGGWEILEP